MRAGQPTRRKLRELCICTELVELTSATATYNMVARFLVALGMSPEEHT